MLMHMREIGEALRNDTYSFLSDDNPISLFVDNTGGHGKNGVEEQYENISKDKFNVEIEWQVVYPNCPKPTCWIWAFGCPCNQWWRKLTRRRSCSMINYPRQSWIVLMKFQSRCLRMLLSSGSRCCT